MEANPIVHSIDTLFIDAKGEILDLIYNLEYSGITPEQSILYNFNHFDHNLEKIDLIKGELVSKTPFQADGPNGTGNGFTSFQLFGSDRLLISSNFYRAKVFDLEGKVLKEINLKANSWKGRTITDQEIIRQKISANNSYSKLFALVKAEGLRADNKAELALFDFQNDSVIRFDIDPDKKIKAYSLIAEDNSFLPPLVYLSVENNRPIVSHEFTNEIYWYDSISQKTQKVDYESSLTPDEVDTNLPNRFGSAEELFETLEKMAEQIRFGPVVYDNTSKRYFRISSQSEFVEKSNRESYIPEVKKRKVFLTIFNKDFKVIREAIIPEFNFPINHYFAKAGKLWIFVNLKDDLAFVRLQPN